MINELFRKVFRSKSLDFQHFPAMVTSCKFDEKIKQLDTDFFALNGSTTSARATFNSEITQRLIRTDCS